MDRFQTNIYSEKEHLTSLKFNSKNVTSVIGNDSIKIKTNCYTNSTGEDVIDVFKVKDGIETLIASYTYIYGKDF